MKKTNDEDGEAGTGIILEVGFSYWKTDFNPKDDGQPLLGCKQGNDMFR